MALTREAIIEAGLNILDTYGLGDLSMRRVADVLGVQAGALYYHVPNKQSLLAALSDEIVRSVLPPSPDAEVDLWLTEWASGLRDALMSRRDGAEVVASSLAVGLGTQQPARQAEERLSAASMPHPEAIAATLLHFVLGHAVEEQTRGQMAELGIVEGGAPEEGAQRFSLGVKIIVRGAQTLAKEGC
ncbi:transcriptional regulator, TetR family [Tessaracoccus bendigoensis DSM 12906]|uniref:Transcriptional regulator, TetR family n=1 Tax=Tessaracoccus bendigoensis DSM 12906 TaxID=1123357 RepID=A0A1M6KBC5_9ACTN|nr:TetR family transcriptional regulator [Tessaracoccus bendigoensis]SHJ56255.1 transcriptional regulator, TetR family [Tessaracoccus bendigoensis DSM 12906]